MKKRAILRLVLAAFALSAGPGAGRVEAQAFVPRTANVVIPHSVTTIGARAFSANSLTSVVIPHSVTTIGDRAFAYNTLSAVVIGDSVTAIGGEAFERNDITSITLPDGCILGYDMGDGPSFSTEFDQVYAAGGCRGGVYRWEDDRWTLDGVKAVYSTVRPVDGVRILSVDGTPLPEDRQRYLLVVEPGWHDIEVEYAPEAAANAVPREGAVFKQRCLFEEGRYAVMGRPEGGQMLFSIERLGPK
jgi:hypothetical protein